MQIHDLITAKRIIPGMHVSSKKRLLEKISTLLHEDEADLDQNTAFQSLIERERMGSTGIGNGVALPHGRLKGLNKAIGAFVTLAEDMDYDTIDGKPINMVFALLVPDNASEEHLQILSQLAALFSDKDLRDRLLSARSSQRIYNVLTSYNSLASRKAG